jgi:hypothetical protein
MEDTNVYIAPGLVFSFSKTNEAFTASYCENVDRDWVSYDDATLLKDVLVLARIPSSQSEYYVEWEFDDYVLPSGTRCEDIVRDTVKDRFGRTLLKIMVFTDDIPYQEFWYYHD